MNNIILMLTISIMLIPGRSLGFNDHYSTGNTDSSFYGSNSFDKPMLAAEALAQLTAAEDDSAEPVDDQAGAINLLPENKRIEKPVSTGYSKTEETEETESRKQAYSGLAKFVRLVARISEEIINAPIISISIATDWRLDTGTALDMQDRETTVSILNSMIQNLTNAGNTPDLS